MSGAIAPRIGKTTKYINTLIKGYFAEREIPLTKEQLIVLWQLEEEAKPQSFLAMITERDKGSLTRLVQSLEKKEYVKRSCCKEDSRVNWVELTSKGREVLEKTKPLLHEIFQLLQTGINKNEITIALKVIEQVQENTMREIEKIDRLISLNKQK